MVLCFEITEKTKSELDELLRLGHYKDYSQAVSVALSNQLVLQRRVAETGELLIQSENSSTSGVESSAPPREAKTDSKSAPSQKPSIPSLFQPASCERKPDHFAPSPGDVFLPGSEVPLDRWLFGQHNKLLPVKASCRALANFQFQIQNEPSGLPLDRVSAEIASKAVELGDYLRALDVSRAGHRDDALSIAFPSSESETGDKARLRYASQFVGSMNREQHLSGLLVELKLINRLPSRQARILLTEAGWNFARMRNPVLDCEVSPVNQRFSSEEIQFLLHHIASVVPVEDFAFRTVLSALANGNDTPERLDAALERLLSVRKENPFTRGFVSTQRSGVVSRMADLSLLERVRAGIKVTYVITELGKQFLQGAGEAVNE